MKIAPLTITVVCIVVIIVNGCASDTSAPATQAVGTVVTTPSISLNGPTPSTAPPTPTTELAHLKATIVLAGHTGAVTTLAWSPDGNTLASSSGGFDAPQTTDYTVRLWSTDGNALKVINEHTKPVPALAWSPNGQTLASGSFDGSVKLWSRAGELRQSMSTLRESVYQLAWSKDSRILASGAITSIPPTPPSQFATFPGVVRLWRPDGTRINTLGTQWTGGKFYNLAWSPDGTLLAAGADDYRIWRVDGTLVGSTQGCNSCTPA